jgi:hypothetical protein
MPASTFHLAKLQPRDAVIAKIAAFLALLPDKKVWEVIVREKKSTRSNAQNAYLWGVVYPPMCDATGYEKDDIHEMMCGTHFGWVPKKVPKKPGNPDGIEEVPRRTTTRDETGQADVMSKMDFCDFIAFVQRFAAARGIYIPDPENPDSL